MKQMEQQHYGGPASGIWCERCRQAGYEVKMCAAREPRRFNGVCDTPVVGLGIRAAIASSSAIAYISTCQPFPPHLYRLRHTAVAAAAPAMISRVLRRSTVVVIAIVRNRSCDATAAATLQHCHQQQPAPCPFSRFVRD